jgi:hypothetical protein
LLKKISVFYRISGTHYNYCCYFKWLFYHILIHTAVVRRSTTEIDGSNPAEGMDVGLYSLLCVVSVATSTTFGGNLPAVLVKLCVIYKPE